MPSTQRKPTIKRKGRSKRRSRAEKNTGSHPFRGDGSVRPHLYRIVVLFVALVVWKVFFEEPSPFCKDALDPLCPDKYFSDNYTDSRQKFLSLSATIRNAETYELPVYQLADGSSLSTDITIINGNSKSDHLIMHISGTHGVEGHAGSAIQIALLEYISNSTNNQPISSLFTNYSFTNPLECDVETGTNSDYDAPIIMLVHALNPYGFHFRRRVNEHNVDLNRNYKNKAQWDDLVNTDHNTYGYQSLTEFFNPQYDLKYMLDITNKLPSSKFMRGVSIAWYYWSFLWRAVYPLFSVGKAGIFSAVVTGQWFDEKGLEYVGEPFKLEKSHQMLQEFIENTLFGTEHSEWKEQINKTSFIDVHTGLGAYGVDTLCGIDDSDVDILNELLPNNASLVDRSGFMAGGYKHVNGVTLEGVNRLVDGMLNGKEMNNLRVVQEFGTYDNLRVFGGLRFENAMTNGYNKVKSTLEVKELEVMNEVVDMSRKRFRKLFYVEAVDWKREILKRGFDLFRRIYDR